MIVAATVPAMVHFAVVHLAPVRPVRRCGLGLPVRVVHGVVVVHARATPMLVGTVRAAVSIVANVLQRLLLSWQFVVNPSGSRLVDPAVSDRLRQSVRLTGRLVMPVTRCRCIHDVERTYGRHQSLNLFQVRVMFNG